MATSFDYYMTARATTGPKSYTGTNRADAQAMVGWTAVKLDAFKATSSDFAAQAYTDGLPGGSSCFHTRIGCEPYSFKSSWASAPD